MTTVIPAKAGIQLFKKLFTNLSTFILCPLFFNLLPFAFRFLIHPDRQPYPLDPKAVECAQRIVLRCADNAHGNVVILVALQHIVLRVSNLPGAVPIKLHPVVIVPRL